MLLKKEFSPQKRRNKNTLEGWAVVRVSKENETKDGSPTQQINLIKDWAERQKERTGKTYKIAHYIVEDGKSGRYQNTHKRKEILYLAELVKMGSIDFIVQERLDRFSRDEVLNIQIMRDARKNGIEIHEVNYGQFNPNDRGQRMAWKFRNIEAGEYSEGVSENVARKHRSAMIFNGKDASPCPILGLDLHDRYVGFYVINPEELKIFEDIAKKFIELGYSREGTIRYCQEKGYKTKEWWTKEKVKNGEKIPSRKMGGHPFDWRSLLTLLGNPKIRGKNTFFDNWNQFPERQDQDGWVEWEYKHYRDHGPLFSEEFFRQIDQGLEKLPQRCRESEFPFSGILQAPDGSKYTGEAAKSGNNLYYRNIKHKKRFAADNLHKVVFSRIGEILKNGDLLNQIVTEAHKQGNVFAEEKMRLRARMAHLQTLMERFGDALKNMVMDKKENLAEAIGVMLEEKAKVEQEREFLALNMDTLDREEALFRENLKGDKFKKFARLLLDNLEGLDPLELKKLVRTLIPKAVIILGEDGEHTLQLTYNFDPNGEMAAMLGKKAIQDSRGEGQVIPLFSQKHYLCKKSQASDHLQKSGGLEDENWSFSTNGRLRQNKGHNAFSLGLCPRYYSISQAFGGHGQACSPAKIYR